MFSINIQTLNSLPTSAWVSTTSNAKAFVGCWSQLCQSVSKKLWLPTETNCVASPLTLSNGSSHKTVLNSWFSTTRFIAQSPSLLRTSYPLYTFSLADLTECVPLKEASKPKLKEKNPPKVRKLNNHNEKNSISSCSSSKTRAVQEKSTSGGSSSLEEDWTRPNHFTSPTFEALGWNCTLCIQSSAELSSNWKSHP